MFSYRLGHSKCSFYLRGLPLFTIYRDHRPLQGVFQKDIFDLASPRLQRLREKIAMYSFQVCLVPGKTHLISDTLCRAPLFAPEELPGFEIDTAISCLSQTSQPAIWVIYDAIDDDYLQLIEDVKSGTSLSTYYKALKGSHDMLYFGRPCFIGLLQNCLTSPCSETSSQTFAL